jgi:hypothetical protein
VRKLDRFGSEAGQGTIEYILLLMVSLMIILGILYQFSTAFRAYTEAFFDGYIACLLETGELPGSAECEAEFKSFNLADGKALLKDASNDKTREGSRSGSSGSSSSSGSGSGSGSGGGKNSNKNASGSSSGGGSEVRASGAGGATYVGASSQGSGFLKQKSSRVGRADVAKEGGESSEDTANALLGKVPATRVGDYGGKGGKTKALDRGFGYYGEEAAAAKAKERPPVTALAKPAEGGDQLRPKSSVEKGSRAPANLRESDDSGFSFGYLLRWLLIIGIIVAILVFFGGQLQQIAKSREK